MTRFLKVPILALLFAFAYFLTTGCERTSSKSKIYKPETPVVETPAPKPPVKQMAYDEAGLAYRKIFVEDLLEAIGKTGVTAIHGPAGLKLQNLERGYDSLDVFFTSPALGNLKNIKFEGRVNMDAYSPEYGNIAGTMTWGKATFKETGSFRILALKGLLEVTLGETYRNEKDPGFETGEVGNTSFQLKPPKARKVTGGNGGLNGGDVPIQ